jgi:hypothetical protein
MGFWVATMTATPKGDAHGDGGVRPFSGGEPLADVEGAALMPARKGEGGEQGVEGGREALAILDGRGVVHVEPPTLDGWGEDLSSGEPSSAVALLRARPRRAPRATRAGGSWRGQGLCRAAGARAIWPRSCRCGWSRVGVPRGADAAARHRDERSPIAVGRLQGRERHPLRPRNDHS